jgi:hypothetical protein
MGQLVASALFVAKDGISWEASWRHPCASASKVAGGARDARRDSISFLRELVQFAVYGQAKITWRVSPVPRWQSGQVLTLMPHAVDHAVALRRMSESECCSSVQLPPIDLKILYAAGERSRCDRGSLGSRR